MGRQMEMIKSSKSETSIEELNKANKGHNNKVFKRNKKVNRNDLLNLPSSDSENIRKIENLHVESSFEKDKASDEDSQDNHEVPF